MKHPVDVGTANGSVDVDHAKTSITQGMPERMRAGEMPDTPRFFQSGAVAVSTATLSLG